jgi:hypothetical protein
MTCFVYLASMRAGDRLIEMSGTARSPLPMTDEPIARLVVKGTSKTFKIPRDELELMSLKTVDVTDMEGIQWADR